MSFYETVAHYRDLGGKAFERPSARDVRRALGAMEANRPSPEDLLALLSPAAEEFLEIMARRAQATTLRTFGRTMQLYAPIYVSDFCENSCLYCGFDARNRFERKTLAPDEVERESRFLAASGIRHVLLLTGESRRHSPVGYIRDCIERMRPHFSAISVEIYPLSEQDYAELVSAGCDGLTIYQETYDETVYDRVHLAGPKRDYRFRLDAPERGCRAGMSHVGIGSLLGLSDWRRDTFLAALHARYLRDRYPAVDIGMSVPRLRPYAGRFDSVQPVTDRNLVQIILALRLFMPRLGLSISTRESDRLRDNLIPLGITHMSAGSVTRVGGYTARPADDAHSQFEISDNRSVPDIISLIRSKGYDPVLKDWTPLI